MSDAPLAMTLEDGVLSATLARPDAGNALDGALLDRLLEALVDANLDARVRVIAILGRGVDFCTGFDMRQAVATPADRRDVGRALVDVVLALRALAKPAVALVQGRALGAGYGLAAACDLVFATRSAQFGCPDRARGLEPAVVLELLRRSVGEKLAFDLAVTARVLTADAAAGLGLVSRVYADAEFETQTAEALRVLAATDVSALALIKRQFYELERRSFEEGLRLGVDVYALGSDLRTTVADELAR